MVTRRPSLLIAALLAMVASPALAQTTGSGEPWVELLREQGLVVSFNSANAWKNEGGIVRTQIRLLPEDSQFPQTVMSVRVDCPGDRYGTDLHILFTRDNSPSGEVWRGDGRWIHPDDESPDQRWNRALCQRQLPSEPPPPRP